MNKIPASNDLKKQIIKELRENNILESIAAKVCDELQGEGKSVTDIDIRIRIRREDGETELIVERLKPLPEDYPAMKEWLLEKLLTKVKDASAASDDGQNAVIRG